MARGVLRDTHCLPISSEVTYIFFFFCRWRSRQAEGKKNTVPIVSKSNNSWVFLESIGSLASENARVSIYCWISKGTHKCILHNITDPAIIFHCIIMHFSNGYDKFLSLLISFVSYHSYLKRFQNILLLGVFIAKLSNINREFRHNNYYAWYVLY